jgi:hypothetical protein
MVEQKSTHEPGAQLLSAQDAIRDAERLQALMLRNRQRAEREVQLRVPFTVIIEAVDQLEADELRLLAQQLEERLDRMAGVPDHCSQTRYNQACTRQEGDENYAGQ